MRLRALACFCLSLSACNFAVNGTDGGSFDMTVAVQPTAVATAKPDLVGFTSSLDGSGSTDPLGRTLGFAWHLSSAPGGSTITDASLSSTSSPTVTFMPDLGGNYVFALTVTTSDGQTGSTTVTATVPTLPIFYEQGTFAPGSEQVGVGVIRSDGTGAHLVSCVAGYDAGNVGGFAFNAFHGLGLFDAPMGMGPSRAAFMSASGTEVALLVVDENGDCGKQVRVDDASSQLYSQHGHFWPRFSPDGSRVVWVDNPESQSASAAGTSRLVSSSVDGLNLRVIRGAVTAVNLATAPPFWIDATHVGWVEDTGTQGNPKPIVYSAPDQASAGDTPSTLTTLADCSKNLPIVNEVAMLPDGTLLVAGGTMPRSKGGSLDLVRVSGAGCTVEKTLVTAPASGDAGDFSLSPDGSTVILSATLDQTNDGGAMQHDLYTVPSDGSQPAKRFAGSPLVDDLGPRYVAGGRQVVWTQGSQFADGSVGGGGLMIANADGTNVRALAGESSAVVIIGGSNSGLSCSDAGPLSTATATLLLAVALLIGLTRRWFGRRGPGPSSR